MLIADDLDKLLKILPDFVRLPLEKHVHRQYLIEVVMDLGRKPEARFPTGPEYLSKTLISWHDLDFCIKRMGHFGGDNRSGIECTLHRISSIKNRNGNIIGLTCRVGRSVFGTISVIRDLLQYGNSLLLLGKPGVGKTTAIREISRILADEMQKRVVIIDTSNEIAGDGDIPHPAIGRARRMQVAKPELQHQVMIEAVENHMPEVIIIDEIGTELEALAARTIAERGVQLVGTAHGNYLESVIKNPILSDLIGGIQYVTLGDDEARRRGSQKSILERKAVPAFQMAVEIHERDIWIIHEKTDQVVDQILQGSRLYIQKRKLNNDGSISILCENSSSKEFIVHNAETDKLLNLNFRSKKRKFIANTDQLSLNPAYSSDIIFKTKIKTSSYVKFKRKSFRFLHNEKQYIYLYSYGINIQQIQSIINNLQFAVIITRDIIKADIILALKSYIKHDSQIRDIARDKHITVYTIHSGTANNILRALKQILTAYQTCFTDWYKLCFNKSFDQIKVLVETRLAIERIVILKKQSVELLPQSLSLTKLQHQLVDSYNLKCSDYEQENNQGLRIYPY